MVVQVPFDPGIDEAMRFAVGHLTSELVEDSAQVVQLVHFVPENGHNRLIALEDGLINPHQDLVEDPAEVVRRSEGAVSVW